MMKQRILWILAAILTICGLTIVLPCHSNSNDDSKVLTTEDTSQFVTLTDVIPDAILEIRYFSTYNFVTQKGRFLLCKNIPEICEFSGIVVTCSSRCGRSGGVD